MSTEKEIELLGKYKNGRDYHHFYKVYIINDLVSANESDSFYARKHGLPSGSLSGFKRLLLNESGYYRILESMKKKDLKQDSNDDLEQENASLKKALELAMLKIEALETLVDVAEDKFNIAIRKKPGAK